MILMIACIARPPPIDQDTEVATDSIAPDVTETIAGDTQEDGPWSDEPTPDFVVDCRGDGDYRTIGEAMAAAPSGSRIGLKPCVYAESVQFNGKSLDIYGLADRSEVVLTSDGTNAVVTATRGESLGTRLAHLTLSGGQATYGSAVTVGNAVLRLEDVEITGNGKADAVIYHSGASLELIDVWIHDNEGRRESYVILADNGSLTAQRLTLSCDDFTYGIYEHTVLLMLDSTIDCEAGNYAVVVGGGELHTRRSTIRGTDIGVYGEDNDDTRNERMWLYNTLVTGDQYAAYAAYMHVKVRNSIFWASDYGLVLDHAHAESYVYASAASGRSCAFTGDGFSYAASWNASEDPFCSLPEVESVTGDPMFVSAPTDFHLLPGSPLIDAGDPDPDYDDDDGTRNDIGIYGGPEGDGPR